MSERRGLFGVSFETIGSIAAIVVGVAALVVSIVETNNARELRYASALPIVQSGVSVNSDDEFLRLRFLFRNAGEGTALIRRVQLLADGEPIVSRGAMDARMLGAELEMDAAGSSIDQIETTPLQAGEESVALELRWPREREYLLAGQQMFERMTGGAFELRTCFCDVYERCWTTVPDAFPQPVDACPAPTGFPVALLDRPAPDAAP